jgi:hypothetical protein
MDSLLDEECTGLYANARSRADGNCLHPQGAPADYRLHTWVVMPNHVHLLLRPNIEPSVALARPALRVDVPARDQKELRKLLSGGIQQVRVVLRAVALLRLAEGMAAPQIARLLELTPQAIRKVAHGYREGDLSGRSMRSGAPAPPSCSTICRSNALSQWFAANHPKVRLAGRCDW